MADDKAVKRSRELLKIACDSLESGNDPFDHSFLTENDVTLDECYGLSDSLAVAGRMYLYMLENAPKAVFGRYLAESVLEYARV